MKRYISLSIDGRTSNVIEIEKDENKSLFDVVKEEIPRFIQSQVCNIKSIEYNRGHHVRVISVENTIIDVDWNLVELWHINEY